MGSEKLKVIRFGIPGLDQLLGCPGQGDDTQARSGAPLESDSTTVCIVGADGSGKSILALHLVSRYIADASAAHGGVATRAIYVSTDAGYDKARSIWDGFRLDAPDTRRNPLDDDGETRHPALQIGLRICDPSSTTDGTLLANQICDSPFQRNIAFIDLTRSAMDDAWAFLYQLAGAVEMNPDGPKHILVLDTVDGLEATVRTPADHDQQLARRARITRLMRVVQDRCHVVFVTEELARGERLPEEFVSDMVLRLRGIEVNGHSRRTIAVEKLGTGRRPGRWLPPAMPLRMPSRSRIPMIPWSLGRMGRTRRPTRGCQHTNIKAMSRSTLHSIPAITVG
jgi:KaiC/GvpD/RAD55 family RecA-like ATPase